MDRNSLPSIIRFFVAPQGRGWQVSVDQQEPIPFRDRATAITAALSGASRIWDDFQERTSVQIRDEHGWRVMRTFGA